MGQELSLIPRNGQSMPAGRPLIYRLPPLEFADRESIDLVALTRIQDVQQPEPAITFQDEAEYLDNLNDGFELNDGVENFNRDGAIESSGVPRNLIDDTFEGDRYNLELGNNFYAPPEDFSQGLVLYGKSIAMKVSGYVKVDLIHDFDPIGSKNLFDTTTIPVDALPRQNSRYQARQSRLNFDIRWPSTWGPVRMFVEGDFFNDQNYFRLRHAYGEVGNLILGKTWTTFTSMEAMPATLDFEGAVSSVTRRAAQVRWTQPLIGDWLTAAVSVENPEIRLELPDTVTPVTQTPDFIARIRWSPEWGQFQVAGVARQLGVQPENQEVREALGWGFNFTGALLLNDANKFYYQILFGDGIGSYRGLPDVALTGNQQKQASPLGTFGWMVGWKHEWTPQLTSNFTYSVSSINNLPGQVESDLKENTYLAANVIWNPIERMFMGVEYLFGTRENKNWERGEANRVQASFGFYLP